MTLYTKPSFRRRQSCAMPTMHHPSHNPETLEPFLPHAIFVLWHTVLCHCEQTTPTTQQSKKKSSAETLLSNCIGSYKTQRPSSMRNKSLPIPPENPSHIQLNNRPLNLKAPTGEKASSWCPWIRNVYSPTPVWPCRVFSLCV